MAAAKVGNQSSWLMMPFKVVPGSITPGHLTSIGTRKPPSQVVPFSPLNGVVPPSGQETVSAPLSVENTTIVLLAIPSSSSLARSWPI